MGSTPCCNTSSYSSCKEDECRNRLEYIGSLGVCVVGRTYKIVQFSDREADGFDPSDPAHIAERASILDCGPSVPVNTRRRRLLHSRAAYQISGGGTQVLPSGGAVATS